MTKKNKVNEIIAYLDEIFPDVGCELNYQKDYELVIAVMLSAQTTDISVNHVTAKLFKEYPTLEALANAKLEDVEDIIHSIGLYKNKAKNVIGIAQAVLTDFHGQIPMDKDELQKLPGVGNKTAGVIRAEIFKIPDLPVDTHILRIAKRFQLVNQNADPYETEMALKKMVDESHWIKLHHQLIHFGRYLCTARKPACASCKLAHLCNVI
ncbi:MAG: endonuclease III [Bacilli bacterium]|nr:endonuclease III [Bacilli bacterium]